MYLPYEKMAMVVTAAAAAGGFTELKRLKRVEEYKWLQVKVYYHGLIRFWAQSPIHKKYVHNKYNNNNNNK